MDLQVFPETRQTPEYLAGLVDWSCAALRLQSIVLKKGPLWYSKYTYVFYLIVLINPLGPWYVAGDCTPSSTWLVNYFDWNPKVVVVVCLVQSIDNNRRFQRELILVSNPAFPR
jgi:hypothetical protein